MNDMYVGQSPLERGYDEPEEDPLVTENNRLTDRIAELTAEVAKYKAPLEQFMVQWERDMQFYNGIDGHDLATWAELFRNALREVG